MVKQHRPLSIRQMGLICATLLAVILFSRSAPRPVQAATAATTAQNIILFIGDGMGPEHVKAGGMFANGAAGSLSFEAFPYRTTMTHNNATGGPLIPPPRPRRWPRASRSTTA